RRDRGHISRRVNYYERELVIMADKRPNEGGTGQHDGGLSVEAVYTENDRLVKFAESENGAVYCFEAEGSSSGRDSASRGLGALSVYSESDRLVGFAGMTDKFCFGGGDCGDSTPMGDDLEYAT
ncbi:MAG: hypothetical protein ABT940_08505, partial [Alphaproteobacteria bacterium]